MIPEACVVGGRGLGTGGIIGMGLALRGWDAAAAGDDHLGGGATAAAAGKRRKGQPRARGV